MVSSAFISNGFPEYKRIYAYYMCWFPCRPEYGQHIVDDYNVCVYISAYSAAQVVQMCKCTSVLAWHVAVT